MLGCRVPELVRKQRLQTGILWNQPNLHIYPKQRVLAGLIGHHSVVFPDSTLWGRKVPTDVWLSTDKCSWSLPNSNYCDGMCRICIPGGN